MLHTRDVVVTFRRTSLIMNECTAIYHRYLHCTARIRSWSSCSCFLLQVNYAFRPCSPLEHWRVTRVPVITLPAGTNYSVSGSMKSRKMLHLHLLGMHHQQPYMRISGWQTNPQLVTLSMEEQTNWG